MWHGCVVLFSLRTATNTHHNFLRIKGLKFSLCFDWICSLSSFLDWKEDRQTLQVLVDSSELAGLFFKSSVSVDLNPDSFFRKSCSMISSGHSSFSCSKTCVAFETLSVKFSQSSRQTNLKNWNRKKRTNRDSLYLN